MVFRWIAPNQRKDKKMQYRLQRFTEGEFSQWENWLECPTISGLEIIVEMLYHRNVAKSKQRPFRIISNSDNSVVREFAMENCHE